MLRQLRSQKRNADKVCLLTKSEYVDNQKKNESILTTTRDAISEGLDIEGEAMVGLKGDLLELFAWEGQVCGYNCNTVKDQSDQKRITELRQSTELEDNGVGSWKIAISNWQE